MEVSGPLSRGVFEKELYSPFHTPSVEITCQVFHTVVTNFQASTRWCQTKERTFYTVIWCGASVEGYEL